MVCASIACALMAALTALTAKTIDEVTAFWGADLMHEFSLMPDADKAATLDIVKRLEGRLTDVKVVDETATPAGATLSLEGVGPDKKPMRGTVDLVKEKGAWKLATQEEWSPKGAHAPATAISCPCRPRCARAG